MKKLEITNFKAFGDPQPLVLEIPQGNHVLLYGENGSGKSSLFEALRYFFYQSTIEYVDPMLPPVEQNALVGAIRNSYRNQSSTTPFSIMVNDMDMSRFPREDYQVFFLHRFNGMDEVNLRDILTRLPMPCSDVNDFLANNFSFIEEEVNNLLKRFYEPYQISISVANNHYQVTIENTETSLSRNSELAKFFNEAILHLIQLLCWFTSAQLMFDTGKKQLLVLDDFITSLDGANRVYFVHYLWSSFSNAQLVLLTHDFSFFNVVSVIISQCFHEKEKWSRFRLYLIDHEHVLEEFYSISSRVRNLSKGFSSGCNLTALGNDIRKCFETMLHELAAHLTVGHLGETSEIIRRIADGKDVYWKKDSSLHELLADIEHLISVTPDNQVKAAITQKIDSYKLDSISVLRDIIQQLRLYQKVALHPLSHGALGTPHFYQKEVKQSLVLLNKLDECIRSIIDGRI